MSQEPTKITKDPDANITAPHIKLEYTCPFCGDRHDSPVIGSITALEEWLKSLYFLGVLVNGEMEKLIEEIGDFLPMERTDFDPPSTNVQWVVYDVKAIFWPWL